jgi:hypothetical protein
MTTIESTSTHETPGPIMNGGVNGQKLTKMRHTKSEAYRDQPDTVEKLRALKVAARTRLLNLEQEANELRVELGLDEVLTADGPARIPGKIGVVRLKPGVPAPARATKVRASTKTGGNIAKKATAKKRVHEPVEAKAPRLARRSDEQIAQAVQSVVDLLANHEEGLRAEQIKTELKLEAKELPRILKQGLATKALGVRGQKRSSTYFAKGA